MSLIRFLVFGYRFSILDFSFPTICIPMTPYMPPEPSDPSSLL